MADVAGTLAQWSSTDNDNSPAGTTTVGTGVDDNFRAVQGVIVRGLSNKGSDIASAATTDIGSVEGLFHDVTGGTTITSFGTVRAGIWKVLKFEGALTLTHNATSLILPGAANITTADGDVAIVISEGSGNWRCLSYVKASGGIITAATQAQQETGTTTDVAVTPGRQHYHPSAAKAWIKFNGTGTPAISASYNVTSITDNGTGDWTINFTNALSSANYCAMASVGDTNTSAYGFITVHTQTASACRIICRDSAGVAQDLNQIMVAVYGDL